jgi:hypothetical protein
MKLVELQEFERCVGILMAVGINRRLLSSALSEIDRRLLLGSTVGSCWDRPSAFAGIDRKLQGELC